MILQGFKKLKNNQRYIVLTKKGFITSMIALRYKDWDGLVVLFEDFSCVPHLVCEFKKIWKYNKRNLKAAIKMKKEEKL